MRNGIRILVFIIIIVVLPLLAKAQNPPKNPAKAFFYSLAFPGLGQKYVEHVGLAKYSIAAEAALIGIAIGNETYAGWLEEDYRAYAVAHSGITSSAKSKSYYIAISKYNSIYDYNDQMRLNRDFNLVIPESQQNLWFWDSQDNRVTFRKRRLDAERLKNRTILFYSCIMINHVVSGIHAALQAKQYNKKYTGESTPAVFPWSLRLNTVPYFGTPAYYCTCTFKF